MDNLETMQIVRDHNVIAIEINTIKAHTNKVLLNSAVEIGKRLKEAKDMVGHGNWKNWLETEVSYSQRTASNLMRIYDEYGPLLIQNQIGNSIADLGYTQAIAMLKLDFESREDFLIVNDVSGMSIKDLEAEVKQVQEISENKQELLNQLDILEKNNDNLAIELTSKIKDIEAKETQIKGFIKEVSSLKEQLDAVTDDGLSISEVNDLKEEMEKKINQIKTLEAELAQKPKEIETQQIMYETPPDILTELEKLKKQVNSSDNAVKFKTTFEILMDRFNDLISILDDIKETEADEYEKYKGAVNKLLDRLMIDE